jgi:hypothetical protein
LKLSETRSEARSSFLILAERALETFKMIKPMRENIAANIFIRNIILINTIKPKLSDFLRRNVPRSCCNKVCEKLRHTNGYVETFRKSLMRKKLVQIE